MSRSRSLRLLSVLLALSGAAQAADHEVDVVNFAFVPQELTIAAGDRVTWRNQSGDHNVVADDGSFRSGAVRGAPWTFGRTFNAPGTYPYYCEPHGAPGGSGMAGTITVTAAQTRAFTINEGVQGSWLNNATAGQGFFFDVAPSIGNLFGVAWFTWTGTAGQYDWLTGAGNYSGDTATVTLFRSRGGRFNDATPVQTTPAGSATIVFTSCTAATLSFTLTDPPGSGTIPLARLLPAGAACTAVNPE